MESQKKIIECEKLTETIKQEIYTVVKNEIESTWPIWKKDAYNQNFAVSAHARKIEVK